MQVDSLKFIASPAFFSLRQNVLIWHDDSTKLPRSCLFQVLSGVCDVNVIIARISILKTRLEEIFYEPSAIIGFGNLTY